MKTKIFPIEEVNEITGQIVDSAIEVHRVLGPGLLESVYEACLVREISNRGLKFERQFPVAVVYKNEKLDIGFRIDLFVGNCVVVELKVVEEILPIHEAQILTYLKLTGNRVGLILNFNVRWMKNGIQRIIL
ncbi:MAG TPA: GxxExxY protein [bacterium]|jgi:GxxExxY protein|nr:GxxExxY protein [bacterium]